MRSMTRYSTALILGAAISACGGAKDAASTAAAGGESAAAAATGAVAAAGDSAAAGMSGAAAGATGAAGAGAVSNLSAGDQLAVINASNAAEIATSKAAQPKLTNAEARSFASDMLREHQAMQGQADKLSKAANVTAGSPDLATQKTRMANEMSQQLGAAPKGAEVDRQYMDGQVQSHQQTLAELQALQNSSDSTVKSLATQALPKVQAHLERAQRIQQGLGGAAAGGAAGGAAAGAAAGDTGAGTKKH